MKRFLLINIILLFLFGYSYAENIDLKNCTPKKFIVSGYYSPLKNQKFYYKGNYEDEVKLNGYGTNGASGKKVFNGMIAAPKTYKFGEVIYFKEYGFGEISDRGGAIVKAGERGNYYDRIDIWMGTGEVGLMRALSFGKKEVQGYICNNNKNKIGFNFSKFKILDNFFEISIWTIGLNHGRTDPWVGVMQFYLNKLGYLTRKDITGYFGDKTKNAICKFQIDRGVLTKGDELCGYFGPNTRSYLRNSLLKNNISTITQKYSIIGTDNKLTIKLLSKN